MRKELVELRDLAHALLLGVDGDSIALVCKLANALKDGRESLVVGQPPADT